MSSGRYELSDGSGASNGVLDFVEQFPTAMPMNKTEKSGWLNGGGWAACDMKNTTMEDIYALLPNDLQTTISEVTVLSGTGSGSQGGVSPSKNKLFLPSEWEMFGTKKYSIGASEGGTQFAYYQINNTYDARIKLRAGKTNYGYWLRSPKLGSYTEFVYIGYDGSPIYNPADFEGGVAPCFAI